MVFLLIIILILTIIYFKINNNHRYWLEIGVQQNDQTFLFGDTAKAFFRKESTYTTLKRLYNSFPEERYVGIYEITRPILLIRDPKLIQELFVDAFDHFSDKRDSMPEGNDEIWSRNISNLSGEDWSKTRRILTPCFRSKKADEMVVLIEEVAKTYVEHLKRRRPMKFELKDTFTRYSIDVIASIAFGIKSDSINTRDNEFYMKNKELSVFSLKQNLIGIAYCLFPKLCRSLGWSIFRNSTINYFKNAITENIRDRKEGKFRRPDFLSLLIEEQRAEEEVADIQAHAFMFLYAGCETVSTSLVFLAYELSINSKIQANLQKEIDALIPTPESPLTYESIENLKYLDQVVSESLRKWPPSVGGDRICTKPYTIQPKKSTEPKIELKLGDLIGVSIGGLQNDPKYFNKPSVFNPERFNEENRSKIIPNTYLPFGIGPRNCIGNKLALLEIKIFIICLLSKFNLMPCSKEKVKISAASYDLKAEGRIWVMLRPRKK